MSDRPSALRFAHPLPYGAIVHDGGVQFVVFSRRATAMRVLLYDTADDPEPAEIIDFDPDLNRWGDIWSVFVPGVGPGQLYHFQADGPFEPDKGLRFDGRARLIDPYAKALAGNFLPADGRHRPAAEVRGRRRRVRLAGRSPPAPQPGRDGDLRDARPRLHLRQVERREPSGHVPGADREDSLPAIAGRDGGRTDAGLRVSHRTIASASRRSGRTTGATIRWRFSPRTAATRSAASRAARSASSRRWCWPCTGPASK